VRGAGVEHCGPGTFDIAHNKQTKRQCHCFSGGTKVCCIEHVLLSYRYEEYLDSQITGTDMYYLERWSWPDTWWSSGALRSLGSRCACSA